MWWTNVNSIWQISPFFFISGLVFFLVIGILNTLWFVRLCMSIELFRGEKEEDEKKESNKEQMAQESVVPVEEKPKEQKIVSFQTETSAATLNVATIEPPPSSNPPSPSHQMHKSEFIAQKPNNILPSEMQDPQQKKIQ